MDFEKLIFYQFLPQNFVTFQNQYYIQTYNFWRDVWSQLHKSIGGPLPLVSDGFTRQDEILALFYDNQPIALVCHRYGDFYNPQFLDDSYFKSWSDKGLSNVKKLGRFGVMGSQIAVAPNFRKTEGEISIKHLISALSLYHLKQAEPDFILGMMRLDKSMEQVFFDMGAILIDDEAGQYYDKRFAYLAFVPQQKPIKIPAPYAELSKKIYARSGGHPLEHFQNTRRYLSEDYKFNTTRKAS